MRVAGPGKSELETEPRPLADGDDGEGELLRAAGPAYLSGLAENAAWHRFERRRNKRQIGLVLVPVLACLGLLLGSERVRQARQDRQPNGVEFR